MRPLYDEFDDFDFADSAVMNRFIREQLREERRMANRRQHGPGDEHDYDDFDDYDDYEDFEDYDDEEFDKYSGIGIDQ